MKGEIFNTELSYINDEVIRGFTRTALSLLPDYFYTTAASSSGKYHPRYALGEGGLVRHTKAAARFASHLLSLEQYQQQFGKRERDYILAALLLHDGWKHGQEGGYTIHEHPALCSDWIRSEPALDGMISAKDREQIASAVASHMGQWNRDSRSSAVLEKPVTEIQKFVHMCDYLASRRDIEVLFEEEAKYEPAKTGSLDTYVMSFGKYRGRLLKDVFLENREYVRWMQGNMDLREPLKTYVDQLLS